MKQAIFDTSKIDISAIKEYNSEIQKGTSYQEAMEEAQQKIDDAQHTLQDMSSSISENKDRFLELSKGVDKFSNNLSLSKDDYEEYLNISNKFAKLSPSLVSGYDDQGNALLNIGDSAEETSEKLDDIIEK